RMYFGQSETGGFETMKPKYKLDKRLVGESVRFYKELAAEREIERQKQIRQRLADFIKPGSIIAVTAVLDRPVKTGDKWRKEVLNNDNGNKWWAKLGDDEIILCFDCEHPQKMNMRFVAAQFIEH